jgi:hypothetical protein
VLRTRIPEYVNAVYPHFSYMGMVRWAYIPAAYSLLVSAKFRSRFLTFNTSGMLLVTCAALVQCVNTVGGSIVHLFHTRILF